MQTAFSSHHQQRHKNAYGTRSCTENLSFVTLKFFGDKTIYLQQNDDNQITVRRNAVIAKVARLIVTGQ